MAVAILNNSDNVTNDDIKEQFINYSKVFDDSLTNKEIDEYWDKSDEYTVSISMNSNGKLVFWDIQTPVGKSKILRRTK